MKEEFLHFIWQQKLFLKENFKTIDGETIEVISTGNHNTDAGPDFFNAKVKIGNTVWAGNVEIHKKSSDWFRHKHHEDKAYNNVILQLVLDNDIETKRTNGMTVTTAILNFDKKILDNYEKLLSNKKWVKCEDEIKNIDAFFVHFWLNKLLIERLERKSNEIEQKLVQNNNNWEETFYHQLARNLGFKTNAEPFEMLAIHL